MLVRLQKRLNLSSPMERREALTFYILISPWLIGFLIFWAYPMLRSLYLSFTTYSLQGPPIWVGFRNYERIFSDADFWQSLKVTLTYAFGSVLGGTSIALLLALILSQKLRGITIWRTIFFMPSILSSIAVAILWLYVFRPEGGLFNLALGAIGIEGPNWLNSEQWALPAMIIMSWWTIGGQIVIYLAGIKGIPDILYEAADLDGASPFQRFRFITLPMLSPTIFFNVVLAIIGALQVFDVGWVLTRGGPNDSTLFYLINLYERAFQLVQFGYASALAWILFIIIMAITLLVIRSSTLWVFYETEQR
ncbi:MAG: binding-protein-dependent transport system inner membrane protein [Chloroflexi bacterium OLB15]|nr:MAG: binding-protein-dependent transport system inner membrane protein [Chloroflexi bacterium OLB15]